MKADQCIIIGLFTFGSFVQRAEAQPPQVARAAVSWEQVGSNGLGDPLTTEVTALEAFDGYLYAGTYNVVDPEPLFDGAQILRSPNGVNWTAVTQPGFGNSHDIAAPAILDFAVFNNRLYAGTGRGNAAQIWRSLNGTIWAPMTVTGFSDPDNVNIAALAVYGGMIYAGVGNDVTGAQIWRSFSGDNNSWTQVAPEVPGTDRAIVTGLAEFDGALYAAVESEAPAQIWQSYGGASGTWEYLVDDGFGDPDTLSIGGMSVFGTYLYIGSGNETVGALLYRTNDGATWDQVITPGFGDSNNARVDMLCVFQNQLYAGASNSVTGVEIWRSADGTSWEQVNQDGFGDVNNLGTNKSNATGAFWGQLYVGTLNSMDGGELWRNADPAHPIPAVGSLGTVVLALLLVCAAAVSLRGRLTASKGGSQVRGIQSNPHILTAFLLSGSVMNSAYSQVAEYTDEAAFLSDLATQGFVAVQEGFEDDAAWGGVRSTIVNGNHTAPSINNLGMTWSANNAVSEITTGPGPARTGNWGFYALPHGDYANDITDGWVGMGGQPLVAIGGWITGTFGGRINFILDGNEQNPVDFGGDNAMGGGHRFLGVIDPAGFSTFEIRETEGTIGDQKFIFADDFTFAFGGVIEDCNLNSIADALDIANETSNDCNNNLVPDECEIDANNPAPGGPFFCTANCDPDCNVNGLLDACEAVTPVDYASGQLSPIGHGAPQSYTMIAPPVSRADVVLTFTAYANLGGAPDHISVDINGTPMGTVFGPEGNDCPEGQPDTARLVVPMATFNDAVGGGDAVINMVATAEVDPFGCDPNTYIAVDAKLFVPSPADANENGVLDSCESGIPAVSDWGILAFALTLLAVGTTLLRRLGEENAESDS